MQDISPKLLMNHVSEIAKFVRMSGSENEAKSLAYVKSVLNQYGLKVTEYHFDAYIGLPESAELFVTHPESIIINGVAASLAPPTPIDGIVAEIVYVGLGDEGDFTRNNTQGKFTLVDGVANPVIVKRAESHGSVGEIFINDDNLHEMCVSAVWGTPRADTAALLPRTPCMSIRAHDGTRLRRLLTKQGLTVRVVTRAWRGWKKLPVVIADLQGKSDKFVLISGHIDSWHYGTIDNATGNAAMLEIARVMAKSRKYLKRGIRLAFWSGHSHGRYAGSTWYADVFWHDLNKNCVAHMNVESPGSVGATILTEACIMPETRDLASTIIKRIAGQELSGHGFYRGADQSFWGIGIPSIFAELSEIPLESDLALKPPYGIFASQRCSSGWWWHTVHDTVDKVDPENLRRDVQVYAIVALAVCSTPILPFDYESAATEIKRILVELHEASNEAFKMDSLIHDAGRLIMATRRLNRISRKQKNSREVERINSALMQLSRVLVPLRYVSGGRFDHDSALPLQEVPCLSGIRSLATVETDSDEFRFSQNGLRRDSNKVTDALTQALDIINSLLNQNDRH